MDVYPREFTRDPLEQRFEPLEAEFRVDAALDHDLGRALVGCVFYALEHLVVRHGVAFFVMLGAEEGAERAVHVADVGVVDRRIDHVGDDVARVKLHPARVGRGTEVVQIALVIDAHAFFEREASAGRGAVEQTS